METFPPFAAPPEPHRETIYAKLDKTNSLLEEILFQLKDLSKGLAREVTEIRHCTQAIERDR